uniref:GDT1 family protein n=1 Tax=Timema monikensis TaxID=170555 RepID=A0A7R9EF19_9NEOP|nr:unnamed protein product [Timema monikensis]
MTPEHGSRVRLPCPVSSEPWSFIVAERKESWEGKKGGDIPLHWNGHVGSKRRTVSCYCCSDQSSAVLAEHNDYVQQIWAVQAELVSRLQHQRLVKDVTGYEMSQHGRTLPRKVKDYSFDTRVQVLGQTHSKMFLLAKKSPLSIVLWLLSCCLITLVQAEKEPVDIETARTDSIPSVKGHILDKADIETLDDGRGKIGNLGFIHAFVAALSVIIVSELGDKTFFIAAIMAMRHPRLTVFLGAISALAFMTILSVAFGWVATLIPRAFTYYISTALFAIFGLKMLKEGYSMSDNEGQEEFDEVQQDLRKRDDEYEKEAATSLVQDPESGVIRKTAKSSSVVGMISRIFIQSFTLTFLAEWGDRSQLATIILAAREDVVGVAVGGVLGHSLCTGLAVMGGRMIAQRISVRTGEITIFHQSLCINNLHHSEIFWYSLNSKLKTTQLSFNHNKALNPVTKQLAKPAKYIFQQPLSLATSPTPSIPSKTATHLSIFLLVKLQIQNLFRSEFESDVCFEAKSKFRSFTHLV